LEVTDLPETINQIVELYFYEMRHGNLGKSVVVHANLTDPMPKVIEKAAKMLDIQAEEVAIITPDGTPVLVYEKGREKRVKEIVEKYGFTYALLTKDLLGLLIN